MTFKDHFSAHAREYAVARPDYPAALYADLARQLADSQLAWDCATGNGQAARQLARIVDRVIASDASSEQIAAATGPENVEFRVFAAEQPQIEANSLDLVTVAQALHWFNLDAFFTALDTVLKPGGLLAVWSYGQCSVDVETDQHVYRLYTEILGDSWWPPERRLVETGYQGINFPYRRLNMPSHELRQQWSREQFLAYLRSWSASQRYLQAKGCDPVSLIEPDIVQAWESGLKKTLVWPLTLIVCRK
jgi:ubiquinone/menaquinone biosynthesis C-methylase UbiE